jgi:glutamate-5-semialdehyde dehydrogenase
MMRYAKKIAGEVKEASFRIANADSKTKNRILGQIASRLRRQGRELIAANRKDIQYGVDTGLSKAMLDRISLDGKRIHDMADSVEAVVRLPDPVGERIGRWKRPNGLVISKIRVPLGVILIIYEARPNVTQECASLCLKSGNAVILKGGRESYHSNRAIARIFREVLGKNHFPEAAVTLVEKTEREVVDALLTLSDDIHLVIPRGGESLIRKVAEQSRIPVIKHYKGVCHVYVDRKADLKKALAIAVNAKCQRPSVCNAMETLLVHKEVAKRFLPQLAVQLKAAGCVIRGCPRTRRFIPEAQPATEQDWHEEYLDLILAVRVVDSAEDAMDHIRRYGSAHTDAIVTRDRRAAEEFTRFVDSSSVMVNTTTRFSDGFQYGFGAEIGISTDKIHARGPMGLEGLTSYKYVVEGNGQLRS